MGKPSGLNPNCNASFNTPKPLSYRITIFFKNYTLSPKIALPTLTMVAPSWIATT